MKDIIRLFLADTIAFCKEFVSLIGYLVYKSKAWILLYKIKRNRRQSQRINKRLHKRTNQIFEQVREDPEFAKYILDNWGDLEIVSETIWDYLNQEHPHFKQELENWLREKTHE